MLKKNILILIVILFSISSSAQNNWNVSYYQSFIEISSHGNYTWTQDFINVYKINNVNRHTEVLFDTVKNYYEVRGLTSRNDNAWFSFRYKDIGYYIRHYKSDNTYDEIKSSDVSGSNIYDYLNCSVSASNLDGSKAYFVHSYYDFLLYCRDNSFKKITIPHGQYNLLKYIDDNTLLINSYLDDFYQLIDTNGVQKKKINLNTLGISNIDNYIIDVDVDESRNIYFAIKNIGVLKMNCSSIDTSITTFISNPLMGNNGNGHYDVKYTADNHILVLNGTVASIYNMNGIYQYNVPNLQEQFSFYYGSNFTINNQHELITTTGLDPIRYSNFSWVDLFERRNNFQTNQKIQTASFTNDGINLLGNNQYMYIRYKSNINKSVLNNPEPFNYTNISATIRDHNNTIWYIKNGKLFELFDNETEVEHLELPPSLAYINTPSSNLMDITYDNKIQFLSGKKISNYNINTNTWENNSIAVNSTITQLYALANDNNTTWVGTDKGIAKIINANIELDATVNENRAVSCIRYLKNLNSIIYTLQNNYSDFVVFNLNTNTKTTYNFPNTFQSGASIILITIDKNDHVWFNSSLSGVHRFNTQTLSFDLNFRTSNSIMKDDNIYYIAVDNENNKLFFCKNFIVCYYYNENGVSLNTNLIQVKKHNISIYPNPTTGIFTIESKENYNTYFIYNLFGRSLINSKIENNKIDISELNSGVYILKLVGDKGESIQRIIKN